MKTYTLSHGYRDLFKTSNFESLITFLRMIVAEENQLCREHRDIQIKMEDNEWDNGDNNEHERSLS